MPDLPDASEGDTLQSAVQAGGVVIADFYTPQCIICKRIHPMLAAVNAGFGDRMQAFKIDAEARPELARRYDIRGVPHLLLFSGGELVDRRSGFMTATALRAWVAPLLGEP
jgi:thioredoxin 1